MTKEEAIKGMDGGSSNFFENLPISLRSDKDVVMAAVGVNGANLEFASNELKNDKEVVMLSTSEYGYVIQYASIDLRCDKEFMAAIIERCGYVYKFCDESLQKDRGVIEVANNALLDRNQTVDDYLCPNLKGMKEKYGVSLLADLLDIEDAKLEVKNLSQSIEAKKKSGLSNRL